ncbi:MAG: DUF2279 domain-containing protein [Bacteroidota bacterium]
MTLLCKNKSVLIFVFLSFIYCIPNASAIADIREDTITTNEELNKTRLLMAGTTIAVGYSTAIVLLDQAWYRNYPRSSFHFYNDNLDWLLMDKFGHATSSYYLSELSYKILRWTGVDNMPATIYSGLSAWAFISTIEALDGFSAEWGASGGDMIANTLGASLFITQQAIWEEQRVKLKFSFSKSGLEKYRPDLLGSNFAENVLKDYNGQTYWLSLNLNSFAGKNSGIPSWLNLAVGYGASGMLGSNINPPEYNSQSLPYYPRTRHWYISPDVDYSKIPTDSSFLISLFSLFDFVKMPAPTIEYSKEYGFAFHLLFF